MAPIRFTTLLITPLVLVALITIGVTHIFASNGEVCFSGSCPPNGYNDDNDCNNYQPPFDADSDGDGVNDSWGSPVSIPGFPTTDECGNSLCLFCIPDPAGPGKGNDYYSPRFKKRGESGGSEVGKCLYPCGRNSWKVCFTDSDGDGVPDKFTKTYWETRDGGDDWPFSGKSTTFCTDLTKEKIVPVRTCRQKVGQQGEMPTWVIEDAVCVELGTVLSEVTLDGELLVVAPLRAPSADDPEQGPSQGKSSGRGIAAVEHELEANTAAASIGDIISATGTLTNTDSVAHDYRVVFFGMSSRLLHGPLDFKLEAGETTTYIARARVETTGDMGIVAFAHSERHDDADGQIGVALFSTDCLKGTVGTGFGPPVNVVTINGSAGDNHRVKVTTDDPVSLEVAASPFGPAAARVILYTWAGDSANPAGIPITQGGTQLPLCLAHPTPLHSAEPQPLMAIRSSEVPDIFVGNGRELIVPRAPFALQRLGVPRPIVLTIQGLLQDHGANNPFGISSTNCLVLEVRDGSGDVE